jgi:hypothetical protein
MFLVDVKKPIWIAHQISWSIVISRVEEEEIISLITVEFWLQSRNKIVGLEKNGINCYRINPAIQTDWWYYDE